MPIEKIVVVEDDLIVRKNLEQQLRQRHYDVAAVGTLAAAREYLAKDYFDLVFTDVRLPDGEGTDLLRELQARPQKPLVVVMTAFGTAEFAVKCLREGAFDYLFKPFSNDQLVFTLKKAEEFTHLVKVTTYLSHDEGDDGGYMLLGRSPVMEQLRGLIRRVARTQATVLIQGESGTGKELVARAIYRESPRADAPFIRVNCAAIPENLIESEFFGHEKGAFTGALNKREGRFELAHTGTILLDEISEISPAVQAKLLRVLQERELERVGGNRTLKVDVRVLATTNRNLEQSVERKEFRQDLFFRLNVVPMLVPPLREHREDIPLLAEQFLRRFARKHGVGVSGISASCLASLRPIAGRAMSASFRTSSSAPSSWAGTAMTSRLSIWVSPRSNKLRGRRRLPHHRRRRRPRSRCRSTRWRSGTSWWCLRNPAATALRPPRNSASASAPCATSSTNTALAARTTPRKNLSSRACTSPRAANALALGIPRQPAGTSASGIRE